MARHSAEHRAAHPDANAERKHRHRGEPRRLGQRAQGVDHVLPDLGEIFAGQPDGNIGEKFHEAGYAVPPPGFRSGVFAQPVEIFSIQHAELVRIRARQASIEGQADVHP